MGRGAPDRDKALLHLPRARELRSSLSAGGLIPRSVFSGNFLLCPKRDFDNPAP